MNINNFLRDDLKNFKPYHSKAKKYTSKLDANESFFGLSDAIKQKIINYINEEENFNIYPDTDSTKLRTELAKFYNLLEENFICGVGSDQIIDMITKTFLSPGDIAVSLEPTFSMYAQSTNLNHGKYISIEYENNFEVDAEKVISEVNNLKPKILFLCTPNNPTGTVIQKDDLKKIIENVNCIVVIDEAYAEFAAYSISKEINNYNNIIVLRTFSKAYGLAGLRIGYAIANKEMTEILNITKPPYNISSLTELIAVFVLQEQDEYKNRIKIIKANKEKLFLELKKIPYLKVFESEANFIFVNSKKEVVKLLEDYGILVRKFKESEGFAERIRISVGSEEDNFKLLEVLSKL